MADSLLLPFVDSSSPVTDFRVQPAATDDLPHVEGLLAGAAEVDITPPPGMPKAGHSVHAHDGNGFRTRLRARITHLRGGTASLTLVQCDLLCGSSVIQHLVADVVADDTDVRLPGLFIGATHTHAGPGQFHGSDMYNRHSSNHGGFDPAFTNFLVERIAAGVREAVATRRPARIATGSTEVWGYTRNRSLDAYVRNTTVADKRMAPQSKYAAINPWLHLLRVDAQATDGGYEPLAAALVFSIHGTGISYRDHAYNADVWAYITGELRHRIERSTGHRPVVGAMEGTHGDMTPAVRPGMLVYPEAERVGRGIGEAAADLYERLEDDLTDRADLGGGLWELDLDTDPVIDGISLPPAAIGMSTLAGARENTGPILNLIPPLRAGFPKPFQRGPHGAKFVPLGRAFHDRICPPSRYPRVLPFQTLRIGSMAIVGLPFEVTVESGRRIESAVHDAVRGSGIDRVVVSSLANEFCAYLTTTEEYSRQCYEGGSTIYGPESQRFMAGCAARLAAGVVKSGWVADHLPARRFALRSHRYLARRTGREVPRTLIGAPSFTDATATEDGHWQIVWRDVAPGDLHWHEPLVRVEAQAADGSWAEAERAGRAVNDQGWHVGVIHLGADKAGTHRYAARWYGLDVAATARPHRFVLLANAGQPEIFSTSLS